MMKKILGFIVFLFTLGCAGEQAKEIGLKVHVSPHASTMISKRVGVMPFFSENEELGLSISIAIANNLVISGTYIIEYRHLLTELNKLSTDDLNEWERFKLLFAEGSEIAIKSLTKLKRLDLVDYVLIGYVDVKSSLFFTSDEIVGANLDVIDIQNGAIIYSLNYSPGEKDRVTPEQLSEKFAEALITAMK